MAVAALRVTSPSGRQTTHELTQGALTIGRPAPGHAPDIALDPDPQRWIGRVHATLEFDGGVWSAADTGSVNGTLVRHGEVTTRLEGRRRIQHRDTLLVPGDMSADGEPLYWELTLLDPHTTQPAPFGAPDRVAVSGPALRYDWVSARAYRGRDGTEVPITGLRPQGHQLLRYMAGRSREGEAIACSHAELIAALWGDPEEWPAHRTYGRGDLAGVVRATRLCIEADPSAPELLQTITGFGYRLVVADVALDRNGAPS